MCFLSMWCYFRLVPWISRVMLLLFCDICLLILICYQNRWRLTSVVATLKTLVHFWGQRFCICVTLPPWVNAELFVCPLWYQSHMMLISHERSSTEFAQAACFVVRLRTQAINDCIHSEAEDFLNVCQQQMIISFKQNEAFFILFNHGTQWFI